MRIYWVIFEKLLAGCYPGSPDPAEAFRKQKELLDFGIRAIVNLMEPHETDHSGNAFVEYETPLRSMAKERNVEILFQRFPIRDLGVPSHTEMCRILDCIDASIEAGRPVYVHCWGGRGRTGTVVGCYLARHGETAVH